MRTLFNTSILVGILASLSCSAAWAQATDTDPVAAASTAQDAAAEAASMNGNLNAPSMASDAVAAAAAATGGTPGVELVYSQNSGSVASGSSSSDQRIKQLAYNEGDVYTITTKYGYQTNIVFSAKEDIETISVGDKSVWQIIPSGNRIFIRPMEEDVITNMTVLTNKHSYQFDLKSLGPAQSEGNIYVATFVYPDEIIAAAQAASAAAAVPAVYEYNPAMYGGAPPVNPYGTPAPKEPSVVVPVPLPPGGVAVTPEPAAMAPASAAVVLTPAPASAPVSQGGYTTPVYAAAPAPLPANVPFGGPTPAPAAPVEEPKSAANAKKSHETQLQRLNSEPPPPTQYFEVPAGGAPLPVATNASTPLPSAVPFGGPTPLPAAVVVPVPAAVEVVVPPGNANFNYTYTGADSLAPLQVFDDGHATYLKYSAMAAPLPDAYTLDASGQVVQLAHAMRGDYMVVEAIAPEIILKNASGSVHVYNESLSPKP